MRATNEVRRIGREATEGENRRNESNSRRLRDILQTRHLGLRTEMVDAPVTKSCGCCLAGVRSPRLGGKRDAELGQWGTARGASENGCVPLGHMVGLRTTGVEGVLGNSVSDLS